MVKVQATPTINCRSFWPTDEALFFFDDFLICYLYFFLEIGGCGNQNILIVNLWALMRPSSLRFMNIIITNLLI